MPVFPSSEYPSPSQTTLALQNVSPCITPDKFEDQVCPPFTVSELDEELDHLPDGKASGYDCISNELLKNSGSGFRLYLHTFLNKILEDGIVPQDLNVGKCLLVHKVDIIWQKYLI